MHPDFLDPPPSFDVLEALLRLKSVEERRRLDRTMPRLELGEDLGARGPRESDKNVCNDGDVGGVGVHVGRTRKGRDEGVGVTAGFGLFARLGEGLVEERVETGGEVAEENPWVGGITLSKA